ncbi:NifB/NifX family molybdenum-iron cluster-binding protein [Clostridium sp. 'deep sea']|uniref:NifB/NifX family molybdenum-iron cluster-binding protein n=1 Tax=Clostridium sp. 'deep sea' TaxID=2779445 RepID=UPI00189687ED|nr:NifB/NifX family molybdenum-iron cluster-binding protein [Clostridium sp. 'deep sea']QOR36710.1 NifB/NifX family molybdenum-iron cluster-binding protein [Clostridium sp. 'deep sea']
MKIAIPVKGSKLTDVINERFGRSEAFIIYNDGEFKVINNEAANAPGGAGVSTAQLMCDENVEVILAMRVGPKALDVINTAEIKLYEAKEGTVAENILEFEAKKLKKCN